MAETIVVCFLNQFFAGVGGEEQANYPVEVRDEAAGSARAIDNELGDAGTVVATIIGGDNYVNEENETALATVKEALTRIKPDLLIAGPAFNAGRYGLACGAVCKLATELGIPSVTAMYPENPGVLTNRRDTIIVPADESPAGLTAAVKDMVRVGLKLARGEELGPAEEEGYIPRGIRQLGQRDKPAARRAVEMLVNKMTGKPWTTELPLEMPEEVPPAPPIKDLSGATLALVTCGGLVPKGNPDNLPGGPSPVWFKYSIDGLDTMRGEDWESVHVGFYTGIVNENPNYVVPLNSLRSFEADGTIKSIHPWYLATSGRGTPVAVSKRIGAEMASYLKQEGVDACLLVAT